MLLIHRIHKVTPGGVAEGAGFEAGDVILSIGGEDCRWAPHGEVVQLLRGGAEDRAVAVTVQHIRVVEDARKENHHDDGTADVVEKTKAHEPSAPGTAAKMSAAQKLKPVKR